MELLLLKVCLAYMLCNTALWCDSIVEHCFWWGHSGISRCTSGAYYCCHHCFCNNRVSV